MRRRIMLAPDTQSTLQETCGPRVVSYHVDSAVRLQSAVSFAADFLRQAPGDLALAWIPTRAQIDPDTSATVEIPICVIDPREVAAVVPRVYQDPETEKA